MKKLLQLLLALCLFVASSGFADELILHNGDRLTGSVVRMQEGQLVFDTKYAGEIEIDWSQVAKINTDKPIQVILSDETSLRGLTKHAEEGKMKLKMGKIVETVSFDLSEVKAINPKPKEAEPSVKLHGRVNVGISSASGNTDTESYHMDGEMVARTEMNRYTVGIEYNREEDNKELTEKNYLGHIKYDHFLSQKWYAYTNALFEKDEFKDLKLRSTLGTGMGYQFYESPLTNLYLEGGLSYVNDDYEGREDDKTAAGRWAVNFDKYFWNKTVQFFHFHEGYQGLEDTDNIFIRSKTGLRFPLQKGLAATLQYNYDWDNSPAPGEEKEDRKYIITMGYEF